MTRSTHGLEMRSSAAADESIFNFAGIKQYSTGNKAVQIYKIKAHSKQQERELLKSKLILL